MSIFSTFANTEQNSFEQPFNSFNMNRGNWGINPNYLTPSYDAPYRPPYGGQGPYPHINPNPSFLTAMAGAAQFTKGPMYGVGNQHYDNTAYDVAGNKTWDTGMAGMQKIVFPVAAWAMASGINSHFRTSIASGGARMFYGGLSGAPAAVGSFLSGGTRAEIGTAFSSAYAAGSATQGLFAGMGERMAVGAGSGLMRGLGAATGMDIAGSAAGRGALGALGIAGSVGGTLFGTMAAAQLATKAADYFIFDNYSSIREGQNLARRNFQGISFGAGYGDNTGGGLSRSMSARIGTGLAKFGARDSMFTGRDMNTMLDMGSQMGLFDDAGAGQITKKVEAMSNQVKMIMSIAQTPSVQEAVQLLAKFKSAGASINQAGNTLASVGGLASAAGISASRMINTVGAQGQYLFQSNGLNGFQGQIAGAQAMASFATAFRSGLISPALMGQMGGVEGASQSAITASVNGMQNPYNMMRLANRYMTGQTSSSVVGTVSNFGQAMSRNPLDMYGSMMLNKGAMLSDQLKDPQALIKMAEEMMRAQNPQTRGRKGTAGEFASTLMGMGLSEAEVKSVLVRQGAMQDERAGGLAIAGINTDRLRASRDYNDQQGNTFFSAMFSPVSKAFRSAKSGMAGAIGSLLQTTGGATDDIQSWFTEKMMGSNSEMVGRSYSEMTESLSYKEFGKFKSNGKGLAGRSALADKVNELARGGNQDAKAVLTAGSTVERANAIARLAKSGHIPERYAEAGQDFDLSKSFEGLERESGGGKTGYAGVMDKINSIDGLKGKDLGSQYEIMSAARRMVEAGGESYSGIAADRSLLKRAGVVTAAGDGGMGDATNADVYAAARKIFSDADKSRVMGEDPFSRFGGKLSNAMAAARDPNKRGDVFKKGSKFEEAFLGAKTEEEARNAVTSGLIERDDLQVESPGSKYTNANQTPEARAAFLAQDRARREQIKHIQTAMKEGRVDFSAGYGMINNIDMNGAVDKFGQYVEGFGTAVKGIPGYKEVSPMVAPGSTLGAAPTRRPGA